MLLLLYHHVIVIQREVKKVESDCQVTRPIYLQKNNLHKKPEITGSTTAKHVDRLHSKNMNQYVMLTYTITYFLTLVKFCTHLKIWLQLKKQFTRRAKQVMISNTFYLFCSF